MGHRRPWDAHVSTEIVSDGNFSLETTSAGNGNGIFGTTDFGKPLVFGDFTAAHNPLWVILNATVPAPSPALQPPLYLVPVPPTNALWPAMPYPGGGPYPTGSPGIQDRNRSGHQRLELDRERPADRRHAQGPPSRRQLHQGNFAGLSAQDQSQGDAQILFIPSLDTDNGVRPGTVPANFWNTSMIFVTGTDGQDEDLPVFPKHRALYCRHHRQFRQPHTGARLGGGLPIKVNCKAYVFGTFLSPGTTLPALTNLDPGDTSGDYGRSSWAAEARRGRLSLQRRHRLPALSG